MSNDFLEQMWAKEYEKKQKRERFAEVATGVLCVIFLVFGILLPAGIVFVSMGQKYGWW